MASRAEIRMQIVSLVHRHTEKIDEVVSRAQSLEDWIYREDKAPRAGSPPESAAEGDASAPAPDPSGQATPKTASHQKQRG